MEKREIEYIVVACCTCLRPQTLRQSLMTFRNMKKPENIKIDLLVVDNDKNASAYDVASAFNAIYFVEEQRGIAKAMSLSVLHSSSFSTNACLFLP